MTPAADASSATAVTPSGGGTPSEASEEVSTDVDGTLTPVPLVRHPAQQATSSRMVVDFAVDTGAVHGGAGGMLYGLADPGVPAQPLLVGVRPRTVAQKAHGGAQHPGGDAGEVAASFLAAGGTEVLVYLQDDYAQWPYEFDGIEDYVARVRRVVAEALAGPHHGTFAWVPFNEPDWIWYPDWAADRDRFCQDWVTVVSAIRELDPTARIVGPNEMEFRAQRLTDFLRFAAAHEVLPDVVSWHELAPSSLGTYREHHRQYRAIEAELGISPREINIDEYGNRRDMGVPGQLVQWLAMFEDTKVDADLAYWTMAGNLDDHTAGAAGANGGWWMLAWYARLRGRTVEVTPPFPEIPDTAQGIAAVDPRHGTATVLAGGGAGELVLELRGLEAVRQVIAPTGSDLVVEVERVAWTGQEGAAPPPQLVSSSVLPLGDTAVLSLQTDDPTTAYRVVLVPGQPRSPAPEDQSWSTRTEAEDARFHGAGVERHDFDAQRYTASGGADVVGFEAGGGLEWTAVAPEAGEYVLALLYGTPGTTAQLHLTVDDGPAQVLDLAPTLNTQYRGAHRQQIYLSAGPHIFRLLAKDTVELSVDRMDLRRSPSAQGQRVRATDGMSSGDVTARDGQLLLGSGVVVDFWVLAESSSYYDVHLEGPGAGDDVSLAVEGHPLPRRRAGDVRGEMAPTATVFLAEGIHILSVVAHAAEVPLLGVQTLARADLDGVGVHVPWQDLDATRRGREDGLEAPTQHGLAFGRDEGRIDELVIDRTGVLAGDVVVVLEYANGLRGSGHSYNTDAITAFLAIQEDSPEAAPALTVAFPFSGGWTSFWQQSRVIQLTTEDSPLVLRAIADVGPLVQGVHVLPLVL